MRIPFVRFGNDDSPTAWWEWFFAPIMWPLLILALFVAAVVSVPVALVCRIRQNQREKMLPRDLATRGRVAEWQDVEPEMAAGRGTLIVEHRSPKGPIREWWTPDDVITPSPVALPTSLKSLRAGEPDFAALAAYARDCATRYVDLENGVAKLTQVPVPASRRFDPRKYVTVNLGGGLITAILLVTGRELSTRYPQAKIVTLVSWSDEPVLAVGDAEAVFLAAG